MGRGIPIRLPGPKQHKYRAKRTEVDGIMFASRREANRYCELKLMEKARQITDLRLQPRFDIIHKGVKACTYVADFSYRRSGHDNSGLVVEDVKGCKTAVYRLKKRLMLGEGIEIQEI